MSQSYSVSESALPYNPRPYPGLGGKKWSFSALSETPVYQQALTWMLLFPLLTMAAKGGLSFFSPPRSDFDYQNGYLTNTAQGIRPAVVANLLILAIFVGLGHRRVWRVLMNNKLILAGLVIAGLSALWSAAPGITLRMTAELALSTCFTCYLCDRLSTERLMSTLMFVGMLAAAMTVFLVIFMPAYGLYMGSAWRGICNHKNALGVCAEFLLTPAFFSQRQRLWVRGLYGFVMILLVALSQSRGAWFETTGLIAFVCWVWLYRKFRSHEALLLTAGTVILAAGLVILGIAYLEPLMRFIGKDPTLTGRTGIYEAVWRSICKHALFGYGFAAFWGGLNQESMSIGISLNWLTIGYAENGLLDLALQIGLVGTGIVVFMMAKAARQAAKLIRSPFYNPRVGWFAAVLALEIFVNIDSGWLMAAHALDWALTLVACIGLNAEMRRAKALQRL